MYLFIYFFICKYIQGWPGITFCENLKLIFHPKNVKNYYNYYKITGKIKII